MEGFDVVTSDDCKFGQVVDVRGGHLIVEHGTLRKSKYAVPETFAHKDEAERTVRLSVSKEIIEGSPKIDNGSVDADAVAAHYGLAGGTPAPETEGYGDVLPDDPATTAEDDARRAGISTATEERLHVRSGDDPAARQQATSPGLLGSRTPED